jgi:O-antigen ligase
MRPTISSKAGGSLPYGMKPKLTYSPRLYLLAAATIASFVLLLLVFTPKWRLLPAPGLLMLAIGAGLVVLVAAELVRPVDTLLVTLVFLASPLPLIMDLNVSGGITGGLIAMAALGVVLRPRGVVAGNPDRVAPLCWALFFYSILEAMYGAWAGNDTRFVAGDFFQLAEFSLIYILVLMVVQGQSALHRMLKWISISAILTVIWQLLLFCAGGSRLLPQWEDDLPRTIDPNVVFVIVVMLNVYPLLKDARQRVWGWLLLFLSLLNTLLSLTRSIWLGCLVAMVVSAFLVGKAYRGKLIRTITAAAASAIIIASLLRFTTDAGKNLLDVMAQRVVFAGSQIEQGLEGTDSLAARRFMEIALIGPQVLDSPAIGKGLGATYEIGGFAVIDAGTDGVIDHHYIHNIFLFVAYRMGSVGLVLFLWILMRYFKQSLSLWRSLPDGMPRALVAGFLAASIGQTVLSMSWPTILNHPTGGIVACVMALTFSVANKLDLGQRPATTGLAKQL